ncbi:MAG TPA: outer membrane protein assembly factor BamD [Vicinamibacterales bacterium]|nr:outer membrane protein assembly factor BamD [Vicinamibacterales bacterium]
MTKLRFSIVILLAALASACASGGPRQPPAGTTEPDKFLFERGTDNLGRKRWIYAREYFRQLVDSYPTSRYRADAKLGIGDSYLGERSAESYVLAINEYREFLNFYPTHERAHYAQYQLAMAYFNQMRSPMRDQTETRDAIRELTTYVTRFADKPLIGEARQKLRAAKDRLADWDVGVAVHYYRIKWYPGVINRLQPLLKEDPEYTRRDSVFWYLGESFLKVQRPAEALPYYERLLKEFEQSEHLDDAQKRVAEIKAAQPAIAK